MQLGMGENIFLILKVMKNSRDSCSPTSLQDPWTLWCPMGQRGSQRHLIHHSLVTRVVEKFGWVAKKIGDVLFHDSYFTSHIA